MNLSKIFRTAPVPDSPAATIAAVNRALPFSCYGRPFPVSADGGVVDTSAIVSRGLPLIVSE